MFLLSGQQEVIQEVGEARSNIDQMIQALAQVHNEPQPHQPQLMSPRSSEFLSVVIKEESFCSVDRFSGSGGKIITQVMENFMCLQRFVYINCQVRK